MTESFADFDNFAVDLIDSVSAPDDNLVWSGDNSRLEETFIQGGTSSSIGGCGRLSVVTSPAGPSLQFERNICDDGDLLPLCMLQPGSRHKVKGKFKKKKKDHKKKDHKTKKVKHRKKKNRDKRKQLRWKQTRSRRRNVFQMGKRRRVPRMVGRQAEEECPSPAVGKY